jgi:hypothetical protein
VPASDFVEEAQATPAPDPVFAAFAALKKEEPVRGGNWPRPLAAAAFHGPLGEMVRFIEPHSEADPAAILIQALVAFGSVVGRSPRWVVEDDVHHMNLFALVVGDTAAGAKGLSWSRVRGTFAAVDSAWADGCVRWGLSSGEGLIAALKEPDPAKVGAPGMVIPDKRLLVLETEFGKTLKVMQREHNTLSAMLRQLWETGDVSVLTREPVSARDGHVSIIGHITPHELRDLLGRSDLRNGLANRFLFVCVKRSKSLPRGGRLDPRALEGVLGRLRAAADRAERVGVPDFDAPAWALWEGRYESLRRLPPGLRGDLLHRGVAQVRRLACLYALADRAGVVGKEHLAAALAVWRYCVDSVVCVFGQATGNARADKILDALRARPEGLTRTEIDALFQGNRKAEDIKADLGDLAGWGLARMVKEKTGGRPSERWQAATEETGETEKGSEG